MTRTLNAADALPNTSRTEVSSADTDSTRRMRDDDAAFLESLDEATRNAVPDKLLALADEVIE